MTKATVSSTSMLKTLISTDLKRSPLAHMSTLRAAAMALLMCATTLATLSAQTVTTLLTFDGTDGSSQIPGMIQDTDGNFYGVTEVGGTSDEGTVFKITPNGTLTTLYDFCTGSDCGTYPMGALVRALDGNFYGTTEGGGTTVLCNGTVFKLTPQGTLTTLYNFCSQSSGKFPEASLVQGRDGNFYGTTNAGGALDVGSLFKITPQGKLTTLHSFCSVSKCADGSFPSGPGMILGADGNLYGTTTQGGLGLGYGTVFSITTAGQLTTLYAFCAQTNCADGRTPGPLVQTANGSFYGTTYAGGSSGSQCVDPVGCGTIFEITPTGGFTMVHSFCQLALCEDGYNPVSLILGSDGNFYGTTEYGGNPNNGEFAYGTIFRMEPDGSFTTLYTFCTVINCPDGGYPGNLVQSTAGSFFGATEARPGTIFRADYRLPPFVQLLPAFGKVGANILILGNSLSSVTSVSFNGTPAAFKVLSKNQIKATVPAGASAGIITVVTNHGTLASNVVFSVVP